MLRSGRMPVRLSQGHRPVQQGGLLPVACPRRSDYGDIPGDTDDRRLQPRDGPFSGHGRKLSAHPSFKIAYCRGPDHQRLTITTLIAVFIFSVSMLITGIPFSRGLHQCASILIIIILTTLCLLSLMFVIFGQGRSSEDRRHPQRFPQCHTLFPSGAVYPIASFPGG